MSPQTTIESEPQLATLVDDWPYPVFLLATETGHILWANQSAQAWLGQSKRHLLNRPIGMFLHQDQPITDMLGRANQSHAPLSVHDCWLQPIGGQGQRCNLTAFPTESGVGLSLQTLGSEPQSVRKGAQMASGMGRMIAHELKNPLAGIKGAAQLLESEISSQEGLGLIRLISSETDRIHRLADRMETLGDHDPAHLEAVNIHEILRRARQIIQSSRPGLVISEHYDPSLPFAIGDPDTLMQAVLNVIKNAAEALDDRASEQEDEVGEIRLETRFKSGVKWRSSDVNAGRRLLPIEIRIIDNGPGVAEPMREQLFEPFVSSKPKGQGLGLALVSKVIAAHGGLVELQSRPGRTVFSLRLPIPNGDVDEI